MMRFNQKFEFNQTYGKRTFNDNTAKKLEVFTEYVKPYRDKITFQKGHFGKVKANGWEKQMWYIDPPYGYARNVDGLLTNKQICEAGYNAFWKTEDELKLYNAIAQIDKLGHSFMVSGLLEHKGQTSWLMSKLIADGFRHIVLDCNYDKVSRVEVSDSVEVIVMNYEEQI
jgi:site-specific DNA-adenine methylase